MKKISFKSITDLLQNNTKDQNSKTSQEFHTKRRDFYKDHNPPEHVPRKENILRSFNLHNSQAPSNPIELGGFDTLENRGFTILTIFHYSFREHF